MVRDVYNRHSKAHSAAFALRGRGRDGPLGVFCCRFRGVFQQLRLLDAGVLSGAHHTRSLVTAVVTFVALRGALGDLGDCRSAATELAPNCRPAYSQ
jgi:hypothetical protein